MTIGIVLSMTLFALEPDGHLDVVFDVSGSIPHRQLHFQERTCSLDMILARFENPQHQLPDLKDTL